MTLEATHYTNRTAGSLELGYHVLLFFYLFYYLKKYQVFLYAHYVDSIDYFLDGLSASQ